MTEKVLFVLAYCYLVKQIPNFPWKIGSSMKATLLAVSNDNIFSCLFTSAKEVMFSTMSICGLVGL